MAKEPELKTIAELMEGRTFLDKYKEVFGENITINHNDGNLINLDQCKYGFMDSYEDIKCIVSRVTTVLAQMNIQDAETTAIENPATE